MFFTVTVFPPGFSVLSARLAFYPFLISYGHDSSAFTSFVCGKPFRVLSEVVEQFAEMLTKSGYAFTVSVSR